MLDKYTLLDWFYIMAKALVAFKIIATIYAILEYEFFAFVKRKWTKK